MSYFIIAASFIAISVIFVFIALSFRRVVKTNEVHIVQYAKNTVSYGKDTNNGNVYYAFPSWIPFIGVSTIVLPMSNFEITINDYEAYDIERLPFLVDLVAFFQINEPNLAAQRVNNVEDLRHQLEFIVKGAARAILANSKLNDILQIRSELGQKFTSEVLEQLQHWGVKPVKNIELMDMRDNKESTVIQNIMEIKQSDISRQSRIEVANNNKEAEIKEIEAQKEATLTRQNAERAVGLNKVEQQREVDLANQRAQQLVEQENKITTEQRMAVNQVEAVRQAEIAKQVAVLQAEQKQKEQEIQADTDKNVAIIKAQSDRESQILTAEGEKQKAILRAEGSLAQTQREAEGIQSIGEAEAKARESMELAAVAGKVAMVEKIGGNEQYQQYLVEIRKVEADEKIGIEQAKALTGAEIKMIVNSDGVNNGLNKISSIFNAQNGASVGNFLEVLGQTEEGKALIDKLTQNKNS